MPNTYLTRGRTFRPNSRCAPHLTTNLISLDSVKFYYKTLKICKLWVFDLHMFFLRSTLTFTDFRGFLQIWMAKNVFLREMMLVIDSYGDIMEV